jgi:hypothetical protein
MAHVVRRNVAKVGQAERDKLRDAILALDGMPYPDGVSFWDKQDAIHQATHVHGGPAFVPWHRELCNRFEALLQQVDPTVALHYWDWTTDPRQSPDGTGGFTDLFTPAFIGSASGRAGVPLDTFDNNGVLAGSRDDTGNPADPPQEITRAVAAGAPGLPADATIVAAGDALPQAEQWQAFRVALEGAHNTAHGYIGGTIGSAHSSFEDPFVFLLHSNVDRLWASWQRVPGQSWRLDPARSTATRPPIQRSSSRWSRGRASRGSGHGRRPTTSSSPRTRGTPPSWRHPSTTTMRRAPSSRRAPPAASRASASRSATRITRAPPTRAAGTASRSRSTTATGCRSTGTASASGRACRCRWPAQAGA